jgi:hypothetical protein
MDRSLSYKSRVVLGGLFGLALLVGVVAIVRWRAPGCGGFVWLASFFAICAIRTPYALRSRGNVIIESRDDRTDRLLIAGMAAGGYVLPFIYLATPFLDIADYDLPGWATGLGAGLQVPALLLFWRSHADLGRNWSAGLKFAAGMSWLPAAPTPAYVIRCTRACGCGLSPSRCSCTTGLPASSLYRPAAHCISFERRERRP